MEATATVGTGDSVSGTVATTGTVGVTSTVATSSTTASNIAQPARIAGLPQTLLTVVCIGLILLGIIAAVLILVFRRWNRSTNGTSGNGTSGYNQDNNKSGQ